ncbi:ABC transporter permease [Paenibacillus alvei]|uniref:Transport permease protein n=1 Tax=Paenibacillus alvei TaxID=44250 RepID=A0AAP6ZWL7_PAEAL|nr:ABC transporter permease [Paenibacillus alvei]NOJ71313.1 ABC transporter permease [Paenibacillus alvei]
MKSFVRFLIDTFKMRRLIFSMAKKDFTSKYVGSYFGLIWALVNPIITIAVYWFVFEKGLRATSPLEDAPFIIWFIVGIIPWLFFSESWSSATNSMFEYSYLVKKVVFRVSVLPIVKIISSLFIHLMFMLLIIAVLFLYGFSPSIYYIQLLYYAFCMIVLLIGLSWLTSAIVPFFKDMGQIVAIMLQFGMWLTPIAWPTTMLPDTVAYWFKLNPLFYIVEGYRDTFISHVWFYHRYNQTLYFWAFTIIIFLMGAYIFRKLKPHFSDVL